MTLPEPVIIGDATLYCGDAYEITPRLDGAGAGTLTPGEARQGQGAARSASEAEPTTCARTLNPTDFACITDPPYDFNASGGGKMRAARPYLDLIEQTELADGFDDSFLTPALFGCVFVFCHDDQIARLKATLSRRFDRSALLTWLKTDPPPFRNKHYLPDTEYWLNAWNKGSHPVGCHHDMSRVFTSKINKNNFAHPTVKPLELMRKIMKNCPKNWVFDPFMGTGTTGVAALEAGKQFIGIEKSADHFEIAVDRLTRAAAGDFAWQPEAQGRAQSASEPQGEDISEDL